MRLPKIFQKWALGAKALKFEAINNVSTYLRPYQMNMVLSHEQDVCFIL